MRSQLCDGAQGTADGAVNDSPMLTLLRYSRSLSAVVAASLMLAACGGGGSSTNPSAGNNGTGMPAGFMSVSFFLAAPANFAKFRYQAVFNTTGDGITPVWPGSAGPGSETRSYAITIVGSAAGSVSLEPGEYLQPKNCPTCAPSYHALVASPNQLAYTSSNGGTIITASFDRSLFADSAGVWLFNAFTARGTNGAVVESMGGACATCFTSPKLPITANFKQVAFPTGHPKISDKAASIVYFEVNNAATN
jgi:hypothetical protein